MIAPDSCRCDLQQALWRRNNFNGPSKGEV